MRIAVVGAGVAGIRSALLLEEQGVNVTLFEANNQVGGRVHTVTAGKAVFDAGGEWIDADHYRTIDLFEKHGIETEFSEDADYTLHFRGESCNSTNFWHDAEDDLERVESAAEAIAEELDLRPWRNLAHSELDKKTVADFLDEHCKTERGKWWCNSFFRSDEGEDLDKISLLGWLCGYAHYLDRDDNDFSAIRAKNGMGVAIQKISESLKSEPRLKHTLRGIYQDTDGVSLQFENGKEQFDKVILTLPPPILSHLGFKKANSYQMGRVTKIVWEFDKSFWDVGYHMTDSRLQQVWVGGRNGSPVLTAYICGNDTEFWRSRPNVIEASLDELEKMLPDAREHFRRAWVFDWTQNHLAHGGFSHIAPGCSFDGAETVSEPIGNVHFAGEHTATWIGFIEGALESAERAVREVIK